MSWVWNGSNDTVHVELISTATLPVKFTAIVTALQEGSGELYFKSTCIEFYVDKTSNPIFVNVTSK